jgi:hypothetical protein
MTFTGNGSWVKQAFVALHKTGNEAGPISGRSQSNHWEAIFPTAINNGIKWESASALRNVSRNSESNSILLFVDAVMLPKQRHWRKWIFSEGQVWPSVFVWLGCGLSSKAGAGFPRTGLAQNQSAFLRMKVGTSKSSLCRSGVAGPGGGV